MVNGTIPGSAEFFLQIDDTHCDRIHLSLTIDYILLATFVHTKGPVHLRIKQVGKQNVFYRLIDWLYGVLSVLARTLKCLAHGYPVRLEPWIYRLYNRATQPQILWNPDYVITSSGVN